jgi:formyl-CoA transferase
MHAIDRDDLADDADLTHNDGRTLRNEELDRAIGAWTRDQDVETVIRILEQAEVPVGMTFTAADIWADKHYRARNMLEEHDIPDGGPRMTIPGIVPKLSATPGRTRWLGPKLGEHTEEVLTTLGIGHDAIAKLRSEGVI